MAELAGQDTLTLATILRHKGLVAMRLRRLAFLLLLRADSHDLSKFSLDEFPGFVGLNQVAREREYSPPGFEPSEASKAAIALHHSCNLHHPEYYEHGVSDMTLIDFIEMVVDWLAASVTYGQTSFEDALELHIERFDLKPEHIYLVRLIQVAVEHG